MTIEVGFNCSSGIILLADRQVTLQGMMKYYETKLSVFVSGDSVFASVYAGSPTLQKAFCQLLEGNVAKINGHTQENVLETIKAVYAGLWEHDQEGMSQQQCLLSVSTLGDEKPRLYQIETKQVVETRMGFIGVGDSGLLRCVTDFLGMPFVCDVEQAQALLVAALMAAKPYIPDSGGPTDALITNRNGSVLSESSSGCDHIESYWREFGAGLREIIHLATTKSRTEEEFSAGLDRFTTKLKELRKTSLFWQHPGAIRDT